MQRILFDYSLKNIGLPTKDAYKIKLMEKIENVVHRMRWKAYFFLNGPIAEEEYKYVLRSRKSAPAIAQMKDFEDDLIKMVENVKFRKTNNEFLTTLKSDMKRINSSPNAFIGLF